MQPSTDNQYNYSKNIDPAIYQLMEEIDSGTSNIYYKQH